ncbi:MAG TPA: hypothetical protein PLE35_03320 [Lentisphaeria bacterium]|nr:hypothetical protein [Lentisphaeria bacterium]
MELAIYFTNIDRLSQIGEALRFINLEKIPSFVSSAMFSPDPNHNDYICNMNALTWLNVFTERGLDFSRLYFGQEFCPNLIPSASEVEQAFYYSRQMEWAFTYVTGGYLPDAELKQVQRNLEKLAELTDQAEVVVNDWGVLWLLQEHFPQFEPVIGRLLNKQTRLNLFTKPGLPLPMHVDDITTPVDELRTSQLNAYQDVSLSNPDYLAALKSWGVKKIDMDVTPQGVKRPADGWGLDLGFYYPWGFLGTGRNCPTAGIADPRRMYIVVDSPCPKPCRKYNCSPTFPQFPHKIVQRGPTLFMFHDDYAEAIFAVDARYERFIFEPWIPL